MALLAWGRLWPVTVTLLSEEPGRTRSCLLAWEASQGAVGCICLVAVGLPGCVPLLVVFWALRPVFPQTGTLFIDLPTWRGLLRVTNDSAD